MDLIRVGRSIHQAGSVALSWQELRAFIKYAPASSALRNVVDPMAGFGEPIVVMASVAVDALLGANWQRGGGKGPRPKPVVEELRRQVQRQQEARDEDMSLDRAQSIRAELARRMRKKE